MSKYAKLVEYSKEQILELLNNGEYDINFLCEYIIKRDRVYNLFIDKMDELEKDNMNLSAKVNYYESIISRIANCQELSTGQMTTYIAFMGDDIWKKGVLDEIIEKQ